MKKLDAPAATEDVTREAASEGAARDDAGDDLLELLLAETAPGPTPPPVIPARIDGVVVGQLVGISGAGAPLVTLAPGAPPVVARAATTVHASDAGREAALLFEGGDPTRPIVMGFVQRLVADAPVDDGAGEPTGGASTAGEAARAAEVDQAEEDTEVAALPDAEGPVQVENDGATVVLTAKKEIVLRCGKASITLTRAGKILIRGAYVSTRSTGVNRIVGGTVQIN